MTCESPGVPRRRAGRSCAARMWMVVRQRFPVRQVVKDLGGSGLVGRSGALPHTKCSHKPLSSRKSDIYRCQRAIHETGVINWVSEAPASAALARPATRIRGARRAEPAEPAVPRPTRPTRPTARDQKVIMELSWACSLLMYDVASYDYYKLSSGHRPRFSLPPPSPAKHTRPTQHRRQTQSAQHTNDAPDAPRRVGATGSEHPLRPGPAVLGGPPDPDPPHPRSISGRPGAPPKPPQSAPDQPRINPGAPRR
jgi:hypothetical protein